MLDPHRLGYGLIYTAKNLDADFVDLIASTTEWDGWASIQYCPRCGLGYLTGHTQCEVA